MGGCIQAIEDGWFQRGIADSAYDFALRKASGERPVIGVNCYREDEEKVDIEIHPHDPETERRQIARLHQVKRDRDQPQVDALLQELRRVAQAEDENIMPVTIDLVKAGASMGDIVETLRELWGTYRENPVI